MAHARTAKHESRSARPTGGAKKIFLGGLLLTAAVLTASGIKYYHEPDGKAALGKAAVLSEVIASDLPGAASKAEPFTVCRVVKVVSPTELVVESGGRQQGVCLLNVAFDAATKKNVAQQATTFMQQKLVNAQVHLESNIQDAYDAKGRRLAYVIADGSNFNVELVRNGFARYKEVAGKSAKYDTDFRLAEADAKARGAGIWAAPK